VTRRPLRVSYTLIAPVYDLVVDHATRAARRHSLAGLGELSGRRVLIIGIGTGLDIPLLPPAGEYVGVDITGAMLQRARRRDRGVTLHQGDAMALPYADGTFDAAVMHLILAVVPDPPRALAEAARVLRPGGRIAVFDKFLRPGQWAPLRRLASPVLGCLATRTDVIFEDVVAATPDLTVRHDDPALAGGWFRRVLLEKVL
jgi:phosphatidylethanolamine/phosphatidyl-N-methylethanolamine N-methyltransferase